MNIANQAWAAGFFDGEGYIGIEKSSGNRYLVIKVSQADIAPLARLRDWFGGDISRHSQKPHCWSWRLHGEKAATMLSVLVPYLTVKRDQALLAVEFQKLVNSPEHRTATYSADNRTRREVLAEQIKSAKRPWLNGATVA